MNKYSSYGYIYLRDHESYYKHNIYKLGSTQNIIDRESGYITSEYIKGKFILVIQVKQKTEKIIERLLHEKLKKYNKYFNGGTEFYDRKINNLLISTIKTFKISFKVLTEDEINELRRIQRIKNNFNKIIKYFISYSKSINKSNINPNYQQLKVLNIIKDFYDNNNIGKIIWSCGLGKALLSIMICEKLNYKKILVGVPSIYLQKQFIREVLKIYPNENNIMCVGGDGIFDLDKTKSFLNSNNTDTKFVITTYTSCYLLNDDNISFDFKIGDEAHHLVGIETNETKGYKIFHKIKSTKTLFMTATEKTIDTDVNKTIYSMDDKTLFGKLIDEKSVMWAIDNGKITDYRLVLISNKEYDVDNIISKIGIGELTDKELFMSAYMTLKSLEKYDNLSHVLICCNNTNNCDLMKIYIDEIMNKNIIKINKKDLYNESLHSNKKNNLNTEVDKFKNSKYGIITSVYIFGEGFDLPKLNGVVFAENMQSDIRIVQTALRPNRLDINNPKKKAYIMIPYIDNIDNNSFNRVRMIISKLRNVDESIEQKIKISKLVKENKDDDNEDKKDLEIEDDNEIDFVIEENENELNKIKLRLKYSRILFSNNTEEQDEYDYVKLINKELNIQSIKEYISKNTKRKHENYIDDPDKYFRQKGVWIDWCDFLNIDRNNFIQNKSEWINFCKDNNIKSVDDYNKLCDKYDFLPREPSEYFKNFKGIMQELDIINDIF